MVVLVVSVVAAVLNVLLYFGLFLPRMTPLIAHISPIGTSLLDEPPLDEESIPPSKSPLEPKAHPGASGKSGPEGSLKSDSDSPLADSPSGSPPELPPLPTPPQGQY
jgi:hypothetical protein